LDMDFHMCGICRSDLPLQYTKLYRHYKQKHKVQPCFECFIRSRWVLPADSSQMKAHRLTHVEFCEVCLKDFASADAFKVIVVFLGLDNRCALQAM
jgi:hypothetical protein